MPDRKRGRYNLNSFFPKVIFERRLEVGKVAIHADVWGTGVDPRFVDLMFIQF